MTAKKQTVTISRVNIGGRSYIGVEVVEASTELVDAALGAGATWLFSDRVLGVCYDGETPDDADRALAQAVAEIARATGAPVAVLDSGPADPGYWSLLLFDDRILCDGAIAVAEAL